MASLTRFEIANWNPKMIINNNEIMNSGILLHQPQGCQGVCLKNAQDLGLSISVIYTLNFVLFNCEGEVA